MLGIRIEATLLDAWRGWLAPVAQPFFVEDAAEWPEGGAGPEEGLSAELRDTFKVWRLRERGEVVWLDEPAFYAIARDRRRRLVRSQVARGRGAVPSVRRWADLCDANELRGQADGHRFVWWPSIVDTAPELVLARFVADEADQSGTSVAASTWRRCEHVLPHARDLAGTFAFGSGPNCFGTVMAAAGVEGAAELWMQQAAFEDWLGSACSSGGRDDEPGTVLVWRDAEGMAAHAAVTVGDGYALEKAAQTWWTPRVVAAVDDVKRSSRAPGQRLERHRIVQ